MHLVETTRFILFDCMLYFYFIKIFHRCLYIIETNIKIKALI